MFNTTLRRRRFACMYALLVCSALLLGTRISARAERSASLSSSIIYCVYTSIFSPAGNFAGVTAQLPRLKALGVTTLWLMPITPVGRPFQGHPAFGSPYCVHDYFSVNPAYGTAQDLHRLISTAHQLGLRVILDEVLNHTSWDNALITEHPQFYVHGFGNPASPASIKQAFSYADVAQLNYANHALWAYMDHMLAYWVTQYHVDGFRFDCADDPPGPHRMIPAAFWSQVGVALHRLNPSLMLLGESESPDLAQRPFNVEYGWKLFTALKAASMGGSAQQVVSAWNKQATDFPAGMLFMNIQQDWDTPFDQNAFGGPSGAATAAIFNFTINGVPLIFNGMEVGNSTQGTNPTTKIAWNPTSAWTALYHKLIILREHNPALQQGKLTWVRNSTPAQVLTYLRTDGHSQFLIEMDISNFSANGRIELQQPAGWKRIWPQTNSRSDPNAGASPAHYSLQRKETAIYERQAA